MTTEHEPQEHPRERAIEDEDPMLLTAEPVDGDPELMLGSLVEEFARQGFDADHIMQLFDSPFFQATWGLRQVFGEAGVRERVEATIARCGVMRYRTQHATTGQDTCSEAEIPDILNCAPEGGPRPDDDGDSPLHEPGGNDGVRS